MPSLFLDHADIPVAQKCLSVITWAVAQLWSSIKEWSVACIKSTWTWPLEFPKPIQTLKYHQQLSERTSQRCSISQLSCVVSWMGGEEQVLSFSCFSNIWPSPSANAAQVQEVLTPGWAPRPSLSKGATLCSAKRKSHGAGREGKSTVL